MTWLSIGWAVGMAATAAESGSNRNRSSEIWFTMQPVGSVDKQTLEWA